MYMQMEGGTEEKMNGQMNELLMQKQILYNVIYMYKYNVHVENRQIDRQIDRQIEIDKRANRQTDTDRWTYINCI